MDRRSQPSNTSMVSLNGVPEPQIPRFYAGKAVFITGASGFIGKVLVERLLSTCPDIDRLFLLMRRKKDVAAQERLQHIKDSLIFENLKQKNPSQLDKLTVIAGDITKPRLGIEPGDFALMKNVNVVFHSAAKLKFEEPLSTAVEQNVKPVISILEICDCLPNIDAFVYVSTAYSNAELTEVQERVYEPRTPLTHLLALADLLPEHVLEHITPKYISPKPNTYTYTKSMAEVAVKEHGCDKYPIAIFRPTIVVSAVKNPFPGWVEGVNGPCGVVVGAGKGLLHVLHCRASARADLLPVDFAVDALIAVAWETAIDKRQEVRVYNCSTGANPCTWLAFERAVRRNLRRHPVDAAVWYPSGLTVHNKFYHRLLELFLQTLPLHLAEYTFKLLGIKSSYSFVTVSNRLRAMNDALSFFMHREWHFHTGNVQKLCQRLTPQDAAIYNLDPTSIRWDEHNENFVRGTRKYLLKEKDEDIPKAKRHMRKMFFLHNATLIFMVLLLCRLVLYNRHVREAVYGLVRLLYQIYVSMASRSIQ